MSVSVIIPCHNAADYIDACLESVRGQSVREWEAIVVDDCSSDDSVEVVQSLAEADSRIRLVRRAEKGGAATARNAGLRVATGRLVAFLDADDLWAPDKLRRQIAFLDDHPRTALVAARARVIDGSGDVLEDPGHGEGSMAVTLDDLLFGSNPLATSSVLVRRGILDEVGPFRERYRIIEDLELWIRVARDHDVHLLGAPLIAYRRHRGNISRDRLTSALQKIDMWEREVLTVPALRERYGRRLDRRLQRMHWGAGRTLARQGRDDEARHTGGRRWPSAHGLRSPGARE